MRLFCIFKKKLPHKYFEFSDVGCWKLVVGGYGGGWSGALLCPKALAAPTLLRRPALPAIVIIIIVVVIIITMIIVVISTSSSARSSSPP